MDIWNFCWRLLNRTEFVEEPFWWIKTLADLACKSQYRFGSFFEKYSVLVKRIAASLLGRLPPNVLVDGLIQVARTAWLSATKLWWYERRKLWDVIRVFVRGAMLDDERLTWGLGAKIGSPKIIENQQCDCRTGGNLLIETQVMRSGKTHGTQFRSVSWCSNRY